MKIAYRIKCQRGDEMCSRIGFLLRKGMVFTTGRHKDFLYIKENYMDYADWKYIFICHRDCKKVFNTSSFSNDYVGDDKMTIVEIAWDDFVRDVLPTL